MWTKFRISTLALLFTLGIIGPASLLQAQNQQNDEKVQRSFPVNSGSTLEVNNYKGTIHVTAGDTNQIAVNAVKKFSGSESERKWWMENTKIDFDSSSQHVNVRVSYPNQNCWLCWEEHDYQAEVDLDIQVPRKVNLTLDGYKPDIRISSVQGNIRIKSYKAPMTLESTNGSIFIDTYKDNIVLKNVSVHGGLELTSYKADVRIEARALDGASHLESSKGSIVLRVPADIGLDVDYSGDRRGSFHTDLPLAVSAGSISRGSEIRGTINKGGTQLVLRTGKGSISLEKLAGDL